MLCFFALVLKLEKGFLQKLVEKLLILEGYLDFILKELS